VGWEGSLIFGQKVGGLLDADVRTFWWKTSDNF